MGKNLEVVFVKWIPEYNSKTIGNFENPKLVLNRYSTVSVDESYYGKITVMKEMEHILKGKKYILVEWPHCQTVIDYLLEHRPEVYAECKATDDAGWFIPIDAMDHIIKINL